MKTNVSFLSNGLKLAGHLYLPADLQPGEQRPAIVVAHPFGGVKEQTAGLYAGKLAEKGLIALAYDASYQGESAGEPRYLEDPFVRAEDIKSAIDFLANHASVNPERIGALGICASGGYVPFAAQTERRIRAVATVSAADIGLLYREGLGGTGSPEQLKQLLEEVGQQRTREARGEPVRIDPIVPETADIRADTPTLFREGSDYYRTARAQHPNSPNKYVFTSIGRIAAYSSYDHINLISPHPLLMIAGTEADTRYFSEMAIEKAMEPKELVLIEGASHIDLYDKEQFVGPAVQKLAGFFKHYL
ncbi:alpha/beta hydrolase [Pseudomonas fluorescens]|uniref:alpha/beta hydrolase n=1 Tax=Pseudomonas fluorescens TaxID=294 RepID=UPI0007D09C27|nr:alpha/beta hydrolase [Pseudomonas fluorescens]